MIKIDTHTMAAALNVYKLQLKHNIQFWKDILADKESTAALNDATHAMAMIEDYKKELAKVRDLYEIFQADGGCMADYEFFAERKR